MDVQRIGLVIRALRRRRGLTQDDVARRIGVSQSAVSRIERGKAGGATLHLLDRVVSELGGRLRVEVVADGENVARLLDAGHAELVEWVSRLLAAHGWELWPEATFAVYGERGSIDILAFHASTGSLLVVEVKSVVPDVQATLGGLDRKGRLAMRLAAQRGWQASTVSRWLVVADTSTARDRIAAHAATFDAALPARTVELRRWARRPDGPIAGILFARMGTGMGRRHRVARRESQAAAEPSPSR